MQDNTVLVITKETARRAYRTEPIYQYDVGHKLQLTGFDGLPDAFQVHFAHSLMGDSITQVGQDGVVDVPDMYAQTAAPIYAWVYVADAESGLTKYQIEIPVQRRARITDQEPTPVERSAIDQEIAALNAGVERAETAAEAAEAAQAGAEAAERGASAAEDSAGASAALAAQKAELATREADRAEAAEGIVEQAARDAVEDVTEVAEQAASDLGGIVRDAQTQIAGSVQQAQQAAQAASGSETAAAGSAGAAAGSATAADQSAQAAAQKKEQMDVRADEIEDELTSLMSEIQAKQDAPSVAGTAGQVLGLDSQLRPKWVDQSGGGGTVDDSALAPVIKSTSSGEIASFSDGADGRLIDSIVVNIEPKQEGSGDASPDNVRPISGWTGANVTRAGKNLVNPVTATEGYFVRAENGSAESPLGSVIANVSWVCSDYIPVKPNTAYTQTLPRYNGATAAGLVFFKSKDISGAISGVPTATQAQASYTFTTPSNCYFIRISWNVFNLPADREYVYPQVEEDAKTAYEPYNGTTLPISWQSSAGTVYGGELTVNEDGTGNLVVMSRYEDAKATANSYYIYGGLDGKYAARNVVIEEKCALKASELPLAKNQEKFTHGYIDNPYTIGADNIAWAFDNTIRLPDFGCETKEEWVAYVQSQDVLGIVYPLATPTTYTLTADQISGILSTLKGTNNIWADCGDIESVEYSADTKLYIDNKITAAVAAALNS